MGGCVEGSASGSGERAENSPLAVAWTSRGGIGWWAYAHQPTHLGRLCAGFARGSCLAVRFSRRLDGAICANLRAAGVRFHAVEVGE